MEKFEVVDNAHINTNNGSYTNRKRQKEVSKKRRDERKLIFLKLDGLQENLDIINGKLDKILDTIK